MLKFIFIIYSILIFINITCCWTRGLALKAIPRPAFDNINKSLAPSPTAITCSGVTDSA